MAGKRGVIKQAILDYVAAHPLASTEDIAKEIGCHPGYVRFVFSRMRIYRRRGPKPYKPTANIVVLTLSPEMMAEYFPAAKKRNKSVAEVFWQANQRMAEDRILEAVLDDEVAA